MKDGLAPRSCADFNREILFEYVKQNLCNIFARHSGFERIFAASTFNLIFNSDQIKMWREEVELVPTTRFQSDLVQQRVDAYNVGKEDRKLLREAERELNPDPLFEGTFIQCIHCRISVVEMGKIQTFTLNNKEEIFSQFSSIPLQTELQSIDSFVLHTSRACSHHCNCDCMEQQGSHPHLNVIYHTCHLCHRQQQAIPPQC